LLSFIVFIVKTDRTYDNNFYDHQSVKTIFYKPNKKLLDVKLDIYIYN